MTTVVGTETQERAAPPRSQPDSGARRRSPARSIRLHRWLGWGLAVWVVFEALTGSYLAVADKVDEWTHRDRYHHTFGDVGPTAAIRAAAETVPGTAADVLFPAAGQGVYVIGMRAPDGTDETTVYVDPGTGRVNDVVGPGRSIHTLVLELHRAFNRSELFGISTTNIVGYLGLVWLVTLVLGFRASRRHRRTAADAVRVRRGRGRFTFNLDLHKVVGLALVVPLVAIVITGVALELRPGSRAVIDAITPGELPDEATFAIPFSIPQGAAKRMSLDEVVDALEAEGLGDVLSVDVPVGNPAGTFVALIDQGGPAPYQADLQGGLTVYIDQYSGKVLARDGDRAASFGEQLQDGWVPAIHFGYFGRLPTQVLWMLIGLATVVLPITAFNMRRARWAKRRANPVSKGAS